MSRSTHGNLTGRAASVELREQREDITQQILHERAQWEIRYHLVFNKLLSIDPNWEAWYNSYPNTTTNGEMLVLAEERIKQLEKEKSCQPS